MLRWAGLLFFLPGLFPLLGAPPPQGGEEEFREKLVLANHILAMEGLVGPFGHVSVRSPQGGSFWVARHISPSLVQREDILEVPLEVTPADVSQRRLYREIFIHSAIYRSRADVRAVVHTHAPYAVALGTLRFPEDRILPLSNPGASLGRFLPIFPDVGLIQTPQLGERMARSFQGQSALLLRGHGAVTVGAGLEQAVLRAIHLELEARTQILARSTGTPLNFYSPEEAALFSESTSEHAWHFYVEKLKRVRPTHSPPP